MAANGFARLNMLTTDLKEAIKGVNIIIIGGSAYAHEPFSKALADDFEDGQFILFTSNFGALRFQNWMKEAGQSSNAAGCPKRKRHCVTSRSGSVFRVNLALPCRDRNHQNPQPH